MKQILFHLTVGFIIALAVSGGIAAMVAIIWILGKTGLPLWLTAGFVIMVAAFALVSWIAEDHRNTFGLGGRRN